MHDVKDNECGVPDWFGRRARHWKVIKLLRLERRLAADEETTSEK